MKRNIKKLTSLLFALVATTCIVLLSDVDAQAAKTHTYKRDKANGVLYNNAVRVDVGSRWNDIVEVLLADKGDYISSVKSNSPDLVAKLTSRSKVKTNDNVFICSVYDNGKSTYKSSNFIEFYATKKGKYTVTVTVKNSKKKVKTKKKIAVYAGYPSDPVASVTYAGKKYNGQSNINICTKKASGKLKIKASDTYTIKKVEIATTFNESGEPIFKKVTNGKKISLSKKTNYTVTWNSYDNYNGYTELRYTTYDYLKPVTHVRVTCYDKKLKINTYAYIWLIYTK
ncbi:MAG: hypothetical protein E7289_01680 [Lachnospiraceae bacterium]|nr:hypothetical protein [Lachnospiraceae bacterium]